MSYKNAVLNKSCKVLILKSNTVSTWNYIRGQDTIILNNSVPTTIVPRVQLPYNSIIKPTLSGHPIPPMLPSTATEAYTYPNLKSASLL